MSRPAVGVRTYSEISPESWTEQRSHHAAGLELVDALPGLDSYPYWHATRAELLHRLQRPDDARAAYLRALDLGLNAPAAAHLRGRLGELKPRPET